MRNKRAYIPEDWSKGISAASLGSNKAPMFKKASQDPEYRRELISQLSRGY